MSRKGIARGCMLILALGTLWAFLGSSLLPRRGATAEQELDALESCAQFLQMHASFGIERSLKVLAEAFPEDLPDTLEQLEFNIQHMSPSVLELFCSVELQMYSLPIPELRSRNLRAQDMLEHARLRKQERELALMAEDWVYLEGLRADPLHAEEMKGLFDFQLALDRRQPWRVITSYVAMEYINLDPALLFLAICAGLIWWSLLLCFLPQRPRWGFLLLSICGIVLGAASTLPTILSGMWMEGWLPVDKMGEFLDALLYHTLSVGFREELCKLIFFIPLLPLIWKRSSLEVLVLAASVGLGFALEENLNYYRRSGVDGIVVGRFVSANVLHYCLTGVTGLALWRALKQPSGWAGDSFVVLLMCIGVHGIYNALLSAPVPGFGDMSDFSGTALIGAAFLFFRELEGNQSWSPITRSALFCWGVSLLFSLELMLASLSLGFQDAVEQCGNNAVASVFTAGIFLYLVRDPLGP